MATDTQVRAAGLRGDLTAALGFFTRLPMAPAPAALGFEAIARGAALAGLVLGALGGLVLWCALGLGLPAFVAAALALAAMALAGGALHEDGLADVADGLGVSGERADKLAAMADPRLGTFGALALVFAVLVRVGAVASLAQALGGGGAALLLAGMGALSRGATLVPLRVLPPAKPGGLGALAEAGGRTALGTGIVRGLVVGGACLAVSLGVIGTIVAFAGAAALVWWLMRLVRTHLGGQTGDVCGAACVLAETGVLLGALVTLRTF